MSKKSELEKVRVHVMLFKEDLEFLEEEYGRNSPKAFGLSAAITAIIHAKVQDLRAKAAEAYEAIAREQAKKAGATQ